MENESISVLPETKTFIKKINKLKHMYKFWEKIPNPNVMEGKRLTLS